MAPFSNYVAVFIGGGLGAVIRFAVALAFLTPWMKERFGDFPVGIVIVNITGCFVMGVVAGLAPPQGDIIPIKEFVMIGILGGYTTFSSFSLSTITMLQEGKIGLATFHVLLSVIACLVGCWLGFLVAYGLQRLR